MQSTPNDGKNGRFPGTFAVIIGPSGVGKSQVMQALRKHHPELHFPKSATTRPRRQGEGGENYEFLSDAQFDEYIREGKFLEYQTVHEKARYGTLLSEILPFLETGKKVVRELEVQGFDALRADSRFSGEHPPYHLFSIFILPESKDQLLMHIKKRAPMSDDELAHRMHSMEHELTYANHCDARVTNHEGKIDETIREVERVLGL